MNGKALSRAPTCRCQATGIEPLKDVQNGCRFRDAPDRFGLVELSRISTRAMRRAFDRAGSAGRVRSRRPWSSQNLSEEKVTIRRQTDLCK